MSNFNPRAPVGRDTNYIGCIRHSLYFNPRAPVGRDKWQNMRMNTLYYFNPRAPVGRDTIISGSENRPSYFNPRAPVGRDDRKRKGLVSEGISIPAPLWGATNDCADWYDDHDISIPAPLWGATSVTVVSSASADNFNPRAPVGRDKMCRSVIGR